MANILDNLGGLADMGRDALIELLAQVVQRLGEGTEFTGEQLDRLGEIQQQLASIIRQAKGSE